MPDPEKEAFESSFDMLPDGVKETVRDHLSVALDSSSRPAMPLTQSVSLARQRALSS